MPPMHSAPIDGRSEFRSYSVSSYTSTLPYDDSDTVRKGCSCSTAKAKVIWFLDAAHVTFVPHFNDVIAVICIFLLVESSIHQLWITGATMEIAISAIHICCLIVLSVELFLTTWTKSTMGLKPQNALPDHGMDDESTFMKLVRTRRRIKVKGYFLSFWFVLDVVNITLLIFDVKWTGPECEWVKSRGTNWDQSLSILRLSRLGKLYQVTSGRSSTKRVLAELADLRKKGVITTEEMNEKSDAYCNVHGQSRVGKELSDTTMMMIMFGFILMLFLVPLLTLNQSDKVYSYATKTLHEYNVLGDEAMLDVATEHFLLAINYKDAISSVERLFVAHNEGHGALSYLRLYPSKGVVVDDSHSGFGHHNRLQFLYTSPDGGTETEAIFSVHRTMNIKAVYDLLLTAFVTCMLVLGAWLFNRDAKRLVLAPIQRMMEKIEDTALNPLRQDDQPLLVDMKHSAGEYEMRLLETAVTKITGLLRVGFGGAGADIISKHLSMDRIGDAVINPMIPGYCVYSIYGFCEIHQFDNITKTLNEEIMTFINSVAAIVHASTSAWDGECSKNLGSSFLLVWRIGNADEVSREVSGDGGGLSPRGAHFTMHKNKHLVDKTQSHRLVKCRSVNLQRVPGVDMLADKSLIAFIKILLELYESNDQICEGMPKGFNLGMGFGLHAGWAIEGAVGSMKKVDTTYLSPHVNMSARMMTVCRQYRVQLLATEDFYKMLSIEGQSCMRKLDVVTVKGSQVPMAIYTYDTDGIHPARRHFCMQQTQFEEHMENESTTYTPSIWNHDAKMTHLRALCTPEFRKLFNRGLKYYIDGTWDKAEVILRQADELKVQAGAIDGDGPSRTLLTFMGNRGFIPPKDWKGYRELNGK